MDPSISDALPFPLAGSSRPVGSSHNGGGPSSSTAVATMGVPFMKWHTPSYNI